VLTFKALSEQMKITWDKTSGIPRGGTGESGQEGAGTIEHRPIEVLAINETLIQRRHESVTVVRDQNSGTIIEVLADRKKATLKEWL
jgi:transposase